MMRLPPAHPETPSLAELRGWFAALAADRTPQWGVMDAGQMLEHCSGFNRLCLGEVEVGRGIRWVARVVGPLLLRWFLRKSPRQAPRNLKTLDPIRAPDTVDFAAARDRLLASIEGIAAIEDGHPHPLYGRMRAVDVQALARHHMAHHAHQFGLW